MFYSKSTLGFYDDPKNYKNAPDDLVEITGDVYNYVCSNKPLNKILSSDANGYPILIDIPEPSAKEITLSKIAEIESTVTQRRLREAALGIDNGWLASKDAEIAKLRESL